jgi:hypothetical protein
MAPRKGYYFSQILQNGAIIRKGLKKYTIFPQLMAPRQGYYFSETPKKDFY